MPRGSKEKYTARQDRMADHIEEGYEKKGVPEKEAERRAWATVNKVTHGGQKKGGGGAGKAENHEPMKRGGRKGGQNSHSKSTSRSEAAKKGWETRRQHQKSGSR